MDVHARNKSVYARREDVHVHARVVDFVVKSSHVGVIVLGMWWQFITCTKAVILIIKCNQRKPLEWMMVFWCWCCSRCFTFSLFQTFPVDFVGWMGYNVIPVMRNMKENEGHRASFIDKIKIIGAAVGRSTFYSRRSTSNVSEFNWLHVNKCGCVPSTDDAQR